MQYALYILVYCTEFIQVTYPSNAMFEHPATVVDNIFHAGAAENFVILPITQSVFYKSEVDEIEIKHTAFSRKGFALGAVIAAEWIQGKSGNFTMKDVLGL